MIKFFWLIFYLQFFTLITGKVSNSFTYQDKEENEVDSWTGKWFPHSPSSTENQDDVLQQEDELLESECDDGQHNIAIDFDPNLKTHNYNYLCLANRTKYTPNLNTQPILNEHLIPPVYKGHAKCLNESISYEDQLPTFGAYRVLSPKFGSYLYIPPQRWMHSLAEGAIVLLYHPCAYKGQISVLENIVKSCLYRHIISPSQNLSPERPMALLAWGKCLQMSVVDKETVVSFIKKNAKGGPLSKDFNVGNDKKYYEVGLLTEAHLVTSETDVEICGYNEM